MNDTLILSASFGDYDDERGRYRVEQSPPAGWLCFDDSDDIVQPGEHPRMAAKRVKLLQVPLPDFRYIVWIDGSMSVHSDHFALEATEACGDAPLAVWPHPSRNDAIDEARFSVKVHPEKYGAQPILEQAAFYERERIPRPTGLYACGVVVYNMRHELTQKIADAWWDECRRWSWQDQVSLPYVLWKLDVPTWAFLPHSLYSNPWLSIRPHNRED